MARASRELFCAEPGKLEWRAVEERKLAPTEVRLELRFGSAKHGTERMLYKGQVFARGDYDTDLRLFRKDPSKGGFRPFVTGNLAVSEVVEAGDAVSELQRGDLVLCRSGFRERHVLDVALLDRLDFRKMPRALPWKSAVCLDPAVFALSALRDGQVRIGDAIVVVGLGAIGLTAVQLATAAHAGLVAAVDPVRSRREVAAALGADLVIDPADGDLGEILRDHNGGRGVDVAIEMSGSPDGLQSAIRAAHFGGTIVFAGAPPVFDAGVDLGGDAHFNCLNFVFSRGCSEPNRDHPRWDVLRLYDASWWLIGSGAVNGDSIVNHVVDFETLAESYETILDPTRAIKLGVECAPPTRLVE